MESPELKAQPSAAELLSVDYQTEVLKSLRELVLEMRSAGLSARSALRLSMRKVREERVHPFIDYEIRSVMGSSDLNFVGYACVTGDDASYEMEDWLGPWTESVSRNAFAKTLSENPDVVFVENHDGRPLCRTSDGRLSLSERTSGNPTGLYVDARLNGDRHDVHDVMEAVRDGTYNQMSFAFRVTRQEWDEDYTRRWIREVSLHQGDVSVVSFAANPHTIGTTGTRAAADPIRLRSTDNIRVNPMDLLMAHAEFRNWAMKCEWREGKTLSSATMDVLRQVLGHFGSDSDTAQGRSMLQDFMDQHDPAQSGAAGNTETESAPNDTEKASKLAEVALVVARNREAEKKRVAA